MFCLLERKALWRSLAIGLDSRIPTGRFKRAEASRSRLAKHPREQATGGNKKGNERGSAGCLQGDEVGYSCKKQCNARQGLWLKGVAHERGAAGGFVQNAGMLGWLGVPRLVRLPASLTVILQGTLQGAVAVPASKPPDTPGRDCLHVQCSLGIHALRFLGVMEHGTE